MSSGNLIQLRERLKDLFIKVKDEEGFSEFKEFFTVWVKNNTNFFEAPASTRYHLNCPNGLLEHSINVAETLVKLKGLLSPTESTLSCVKIGLLHDLGKAGDVGVPYYIPNEPTPNQKKYGYDAYPPFIINPDLKPYMEVPDRSLYLIGKYANFDLTPEEFQAIRIHDGMYADNNKSYACKECTLALLLHMADSWSGFQLETVTVKDWRK